ncbi:hypothetical protein ACHAWF_008424 [Thalassiosira exigua]
MASNQAFASKKTSLITILSSAHGRLRREQRDIDKRDLQRALKYGRPERAWGQRWLVDYDGITYITNSTMRQEITAYPSPLPEFDVDVSAMHEHEKVQRLLQQKPELSTSHTVIVIDNSGSMLGKKNDVHLYRDSQNAAFSMTALEFVAEQLFSNTAVNSDLVSLIKFSDQPSVEFSLEPIGWPVYNKILRHRNKDSYVDRQTAPFMDGALGQSNFIPALNKALELLEKISHDQCASSLFFFSDGKSTDHQKQGISAEESYERMNEVITSMASRFKDSLTISLVGLGDVRDEFEPLKKMAIAASAAGAKGSFERCEKTAAAISSSISSMVTSTTETRLALQEGGRSRFTERSGLTSEKISFPKCNWRVFRIAYHYVYQPNLKQLVLVPMLPLAAVHSSPEEASRRMKSPPPYIAINANYFGKGAERVAFRCRLSDTEKAKGFVFEEMIAKETKYEQRIDERIAFHKTFTETQDLANYLANEYNQLLQSIPLQTPQLRFLSCSVLVLEDPTFPGGLRGVLVEKMLDTDRFPWVKWNDNNGGLVNGKRKHVAIDVDFELKELQRENARDNLGAIVEEEEDSDDDESISDVESDDSQNDDVEVTSNTLGINPSEYLQAFTHFTYRFTKKKVMVCDLQGVFNTEMSPPTIEMTDPAIHYASTRGRRMVFGRTDKGRSGMNSFFKTHKCTKICKYLHLSARNKKWNQDWRRESAQRTNFRHN